MFSVPPPTKYDLRFTIFGFPIRVHPFFWLIMILFGYSTNIINLIIWVVVVFVSLLIHELGHTFAMRHYGISSHIVLHSFGGLAIPDSFGFGSSRSSLSNGQQIIISLAGPFAGFFLAGLILGLVQASGGTIQLSGILPQASVPFGGQVVARLINTSLWINIFWGLINLLPVFPLDGGQVSRYFLTSIDPHNGFRNALWLSVIVGGIAAIAGYAYLRSIWIAFLFGLLAFQSFQMLNGR